MDNNKTVCFAGHRYEWNNIGIENILKITIEKIIKLGYTTFFDGNKGDFDKKALTALISLKSKYPYIKIIKVLSNYTYKKEKVELPSYYDYTILPDIEEIYPKQRIIKRNQWIIDNSDVVICHIVHTVKSGAYQTVQYAKTQNKEIIEI